MQLIVELPVDAEEYISQKFQHSITAPAACPHCRACASLQALGYYLRSITGKKAVALTISVRRFRCKVCKKTVSILPAFAQPYRLVRNHAIHRYFCVTATTGTPNPGWCSCEDIGRSFAGGFRGLMPSGTAASITPRHPAPAPRGGSWSWTLSVA